jgi:hypothetical protein
MREAFYTHDPQTALELPWKNRLPGLRGVAPGASLPATEGAIRGVELSASLARSFPLTRLSSSGHETPAESPCWRIILLEKWIGPLLERNDALPILSFTRS